MLLAWGRALQGSHVSVVPPRRGFCFCILFVCLAGFFVVVVVVLFFLATRSMACSHVKVAFLGYQSIQKRCGWIVMRISWGPGLFSSVSLHHKTVQQWGGETCRLSKVYTLETHRTQHISRVWHLSHKENDVSQREHAWSVWLLSHSKPGIIPSVIGSPWFCGAMTQSRKGQASIDAHYDAFTAHQFICFDALHKLRTRGYRQKSLAVLHAARRHKASKRALLEYACSLQGLASRTRKCIE